MDPDAPSRTPSPPPIPPPAEAAQKPKYKASQCAPHSSDSAPPSPAAPKAAPAAKQMDYSASSAPALAHWKHFAAQSSLPESDNQNSAASAKENSASRSHKWSSAH